MNNDILINPIYSYVNPYAQRKEIYKDLNNKGGVYLWTNIISNKKYVGSAVDLKLRLRSYFSRAHLKLELKTNNSLIYKAILKYNYENFRLDILEICNVEYIIEREQYYLDNLKLEYNTLKVAKSLLGFKHSEFTKQRIREAKLGKPISEEIRMKLYENWQAFPLEIKNIQTGDITYSSSIRRAAAYTGIHHSYIAKCLIKNKFYRGRDYYITKRL